MTDEELRTKGPHVWCNFQGRRDHDPATCVSCRRFWEAFDYDKEADPGGLDLAAKHFPEAVRVRE